MTRQETQILKGIAIMLMLFLHLFNQSTNVALCTSLLYIGETPAVSIIQRCTNPVSFFLVLGGYGLYCVYCKGDKHRISRIMKLLCHYWLILLVFAVCLGTIVRPDTYPGSVVNFLGNVFAVDTTYNAEWWFLLPYVILSLFAKYIFYFFDKFRARYVLIFTFFLGLCTSYFISRHGAQYLYNNHWLYNPFLCLHLLPAFIWGAMAAKCNVFKRSTIVNGRGGFCSLS